MNSALPSLAGPVTVIWIISIDRRALDERRGDIWERYKRKGWIRSWVRQKKFYLSCLSKTVSNSYRHFIVWVCLSITRHYRQERKPHTWTKMLQLFLLEKRFKITSICGVIHCIIYIVISRFNPRTSSKFRATVAELADARDLKSLVGDSIRVRFSSVAP